MSTTSSDDAQCKALTADGDRCQRPAQADGFCYQHDESDETVEERTEETVDEKTEETADDGEEGGGASAAENGNEESAMTSSESDRENVDIGAIRERVQETAADVVGYPLEGITSVDSTDEGWRVAVEVVERKAVPDTQDILGRYELRLDDGLDVTGYQRTHRYRRDDMDHDI